MTLSDPTPSLLAVSMLLDARKEVRARGDGSHKTISAALWAVIDELHGEESAVATMLVRIDNEKTQAQFRAICASCW